MKEIIDIFILYFYPISGGILSLSFGGYIVWRISQKTKRRDAIDKFVSIFTDEREKIKVFNIQDFNLQERTIFEVKRSLHIWQGFRLDRRWHDYREIENKYRQVLPTQDTPPNHLIHYGDHKNEVLGKINEIINWL